MAGVTRTRCSSGRSASPKGSKSIYDELAAKGRVSTQGILFDTGSDKIKPESTPTLKDIGAMLAAHPELKLSVEGHTDNLGDAAANLKLSESRAAAVKAALVKDFGVDAGRLTSKGWAAPSRSRPIQRRRGVRPIAGWSWSKCDMDGHRRGFPRRWQAPAAQRFSVVRESKEKSPTTRKPPRR
jgi:hypothetical protein